jgi:phosphate starvation-inducible PhoH-like protein
MADEMQNSTPNQMRMVLTRIGQGSKMVVTGDTDQHDRGFEQNGLCDLMSRVDPDNELINVVQFNKSDIQRNKVIKEILKLYQ